MPIEWTSGSWFLELLNWSVAFWNDVVGLGVGLLTQSPEQISPGIWNIIRAISDSLQGIGYGLLVLFFLASLFKQTTNLKDFTFQSVFGYLLRFLGGKLAIDYSMTILSSIMAVVLEIGGVIGASGSGLMLEGVPQNIADMAGSLNIFNIGDQLPLLLLSLVGCLFAIIFGILFLICVYGRFFRVYIHIALAPIGFSAFGGESTAGSGKHYLMSFLSCCLESAVILLAVVICKGIISGGGIHIPMLDEAGVVTQLAGYIVQNLFAMVLLTVLTFGVNRLTKEMFGGM